MSIKIDLASGKSIFVDFPDVDKRQFEEIRCTRYLLPVDWINWVVRATITRRICTLTHLELYEPARNFNQAIAPWEGFWVSDGSKITSLNNGLSVAPTNVRRLLYQKS